MKKMTSPQTPLLKLGEGLNGCTNLTCLSSLSLRRGGTEGEVVVTNALPGVEPFQGRHRSIVQFNREGRLKRSSTGIFQPGVESLWI